MYTETDLNELVRKAEGLIRGCFEENTAEAIIFATEWPVEDIDVDVNTYGNRKSYNSIRDLLSDTVHAYVFGSAVSGTDTIEY